MTIVLWNVCGHLSVPGLKLFYWMSVIICLLEKLLENLNQWYCQAIWQTMPSVCENVPCPKKLLVIHHLSCFLLVNKQFCWKYSPIKRQAGKQNLPILLCFFLSAWKRANNAKVVKITLFMTLKYALLWNIRNQRVSKSIQHYQQQKCKQCINSNIMQIRTQ